MTPTAPQWEKWKCRCSAISKMMANSKGNEPLTDKQVEEVAKLRAKLESGKITDPQKIELARLLQKEEDSGKFVISDSTANYLLEAYAWETEKMCSITKEMDVEYFDRGRKTEPESIELLKEVDNCSYTKNETRFENDFLSGIPDVIEIKEMIGVAGPIFYASSIWDIKSTKDYPTFLYKMHKGLDAGNEDQLKGYGDILECGDLGVAFTLPTMPESNRAGYKIKLAYKMNAAIDQDPEFEKAWANLERSMIFDHMSANRRVYKIPVAPFTTNEQSAVYERVKVCREWLQIFHQTYIKLNQ